jgi:ubiquinone biosynthesis protein
MFAGQWKFPVAILMGEAPPHERAAALEEALRTPEGQGWRKEIGARIAQLVPVEIFVPDVARAWRRLVRDAMEFVFSHLSERRLAAKLVEQIDLPFDTPPETRLIRLIAKMPGLQKMGQVLARNPRLPQVLCTALSELENGMADVTIGEIRAIIEEQLGERLTAHSVVLGRSIFSEASVSAVVRFTWKKPDREREHGVFKVLKPYVPACFAEDMTLLQQLGEFLASPDRGYEIAIRDVTEMLVEVRMLLEHELEFTREQATLEEVQGAYRASIGIRVPRVIHPLCTGRITAMSEEKGVKVTDAFRRWPLRRARIAGQMIEALIAVPLFSRSKQSVFHADPHAGNLLYDEPNRELVVLDWALAERLSLDQRRRIVMLVLMTVLRNQEGVTEAIVALNRAARGQRRAERLIRDRVDAFFARLPPDYSPGALDAMRLLDSIALEGVRFPAALFLFRKSVFTLDGVLNAVSGSAVAINQVLARDYLTRWISSFGLFRAPLEAADVASVEWSAVRNQAGRLWRKLRGAGSYA